MAVSRKVAQVKSTAAFVQYFPRQAISFGILIWSETKAVADDFDQTIRELLNEYGYDFSAPDSRSEFKGTYFIKYDLHLKSGDLEEDLHLEMTDQPPRKDLPAKKRSLLTALKRKLEKLKVIMLVGGLLCASAAAGREAYGDFLKAIHAPPPPSITRELPAGLPPGSKVIETKIGQPQIILISIPPAMVPVIENAEKDPKKLEFLMQFLIANYFEANPKSL